jgi:protein-tyrosine phosphatase
MRTETSSRMPHRVLFVCTANICRSPTAEGVLRAIVAREGLAGQVQVASVGLEGWHAGAPPDARTQAHALRRGHDLSALRASAFVAADFERHDWIVALDAGHHARLVELCPPELQHKLKRAAEFSARVPAGGVPDPYYGDARGFDNVFEMVESVCEGVLAQYRAERADRADRSDIP